MGWDLKNPVIQFVPLTLRIRNGPSVSFGTNVPSNCCPGYFRVINLPRIKNKKQFPKNYQKTYDSSMIFGYIFLNRIHHKLKFSIIYF